LGECPTPVRFSGIIHFMKPRLPYLTTLLAALLAPVSFLSAQTLPTPAPATAQPARTTTTYTLSNGMQLWVRPDRRAPTAVHMVWVRVGSMDEVDGTSGVAHVLEHMMFKGTAKLAPGEFSRRVAALGGGKTPSPPRTTPAISSRSRPAASKT